MLTFRPLADDDLPMVEKWLNKPHVKRWYEIPQLAITINDWLFEMNHRDSTFHWLTYLIVSWQDHPIGLCQYYKCVDSDEDFGSLPLNGSYGIDYLIGEEAYLGKGLGTQTVAQLVDTLFSFSDVKRVTADIAKDNTASKHTLSTCGFSLLDEGQHRYVIYKPKRTN